MKTSTSVDIFIFMRNNIPFFIIVVLGILLAILHYSASLFDLFWVISWFDLLMHTLGGAWIAALSFWFLFHFSLFKDKKKNRTFVVHTLLTSTLIVGILWEIFELQTGLMSASEYHYWRDTISDLVMAIIGASAVIFLFLKIKKNSGF